MAAPRLPFLWPMLMRSVEAAPRVRSVRPASRFRAAHSTTRRRQQETAVTSRYGPANEPPPHIANDKKEAKAPAKAKEQTKLPKIGEKLQKDGQAKAEAEQEAKAKSAAETTTAAGPPSKTVDDGFTSPIQSDPMLDSSESQPEVEPPDASETPAEKPMETILESVPDPAQKQREDQEAKQAPMDGVEQPELSFDEHSPPVRAPHIDPPRHIHHFDTYGLVKRLSEGGWNEQQAITTMKAVRLMLADNMTLAKEALVSKSNVENETYLFRAACAELKTEVNSRRQAEQEKMRTERTQLQHEVDILNQRMSQESGNLKDDLKGMFDDRKMAVRNEQRGMESKVQQLNYKITVNLQADAKSEVEGLRWVMTRRVIIALFVVVIMVVGGLKLISNAIHEQEIEAKRRAKRKSASTQTGERRNTDEFNQNGGNRSSSSSQTPHDGNADEMLVTEGVNPAFVSLG